MIIAGEKTHYFNSGMVARVLLNVDNTLTYIYK